MQMLESREDKGAESVARFLECVLSSWPYVVEVMLHRRIGIRYLDSRLIGAFAILLLYPLFWERYDLRAYGWFSALFVVAHCVQRLNALYLARKGRMGHSFYDGEPVLLRLFPRVSERGFKRFIEPVLVFFAGIYGIQFDTPVAVFTIIAAVLMHMNNQLSERREHIRAIAMNDAWIESQMASDRFRGLNGSLN